ncbi:MAG: double zinc ribbon domain-containing protein [Methylomonas sp.]
MNPLIKRCLDFRFELRNKLLPPRCILCGQPGMDDLDLCADCYDDLPRNRHCCYRCGENFAVAVSAPQLCGRCLAKPPHFDETLAPFLYQGNIRYLITQLKFGHQYKNARLLAALLVRHIAQNAELPDCIVPVPLHRNRYRHRGFNQSIELARHLSKLLRLPMDLHSCVRNRDTAHQTSLPAKQRDKNMRMAFNIENELNFQHVAIIDDVLTTGATVSELALALKQSGIRRVDVWVCARA